MARDQIIHDESYSKRYPISTLALGTPTVTARPLRQALGITVRSLHSSLVPREIGGKRAPRGRGISRNDPARLEIPVLRMPNRYQLPTVDDLF